MREVQVGAGEGLGEVEGQVVGMGAGRSDGWMMLGDRSVRVVDSLPTGRAGRGVLGQVRKATTRKRVSHYTGVGVYYQQMELSFDDNECPIGSQFSLIDFRQRKL